MTNMRKIIQITFFWFLIFCAMTKSLGQETKSNDPDLNAKELLYSKYRKEVLSYDKKAFDALFFEFFQKQSDSNLTLSKEEFYTYTIKIAIYSEKMGMLYKDQKAEATKSKEDWFNRNYSDYLNSKK